MAQGDFGNAATMDGNTLAASLFKDAANVGTAYFAADAAKATVKANPGSATTLIIVAGVVVLGAVLLLKR